MRSYRLRLAGAATRTDLELVGDEELKLESTFTTAFLEQPLPRVATRPHLQTRRRVNHKQRHLLTIFFLLFFCLV